mmetsp:Transcript_16069/g.34993  ORF Transcript_16069/g.34993 Transcript_16069/m.34993 type:complete len:111 (-) Transcript_16069:409-741(-)
MLGAVSPWNMKVSNPPRLLAKHKHSEERHRITASVWVHRGNINIGNELRENMVIILGEETCQSRRALWAVVGDICQDLEGPEHETLRGLVLTSTDLGEHDSSKIGVGLGG